MNILYFPQLSMYNKQTKNYIPAADGNINMMRNFINEWKKYRSDNFFVLMPEVVPTYDLNIDCKYFYYENSVVSARINRYNFPMKEFSRKLKTYGKFDLIICDIPELARNFKAMFNVEFGYDVKIISNIRHIDEFKENKYDYLLRVADGIDCSDMCTILSESMKTILNEQLADVLEYNFASDLIEKVEVFEPSVSSNEILSLIEEKNKFHFSSKKVITFPGRLSKGEEKRTNWDKFQHAILKLRETRQDFEIYFTDPQNSMTDILKDNLLYWIKTINKDRKEFINLLHKTDIVVSLMDIQGFGGISIREALLLGCLPVIPKKHEYKNMMPIDYPGFVNGEITVDKLVEKLNWTLNYNGNQKDLINSYASKYTIESQMKDLMTKLEVIINEKL